MFPSSLPLNSGKHAFRTVMNVLCCIAGFSITVVLWLIPSHVSFLDFSSWLYIETLGVFDPTGYEMLGLVRQFTLLPVAISFLLCPQNFPDDTRRESPASKSTLKLLQSMHIIEQVAGQTFPSIWSPFIWNALQKLMTHTQPVFILEKLGRVIVVSLASINSPLLLSNLCTVSSSNGLSNRVAPSVWHLLGLCPHPLPVDVKNISNTTPSGERFPKFPM